MKPPTEESDVSDLCCWYRTPITPPVARTQKCLIQCAVHLMYLLVQKKNPDGYKIKKLNILTEPAEEQLCAACEQTQLYFIIYKSHYSFLVFFKNYFYSVTCPNSFCGI